MLCQCKERGVIISGATGGAGHLQENQSLRLQGKSYRVHLQLVHLSKRLDAESYHLKERDIEISHPSLRGRLD